MKRASGTRMLDVMVEASKRCGEHIGGKYVLGDVIGVGGMGVVYSAVQRSLGRRVAIKMPRPDALSQPAVHRRFRTEAFVASRLWHRNIVAVIDYGDHNGTPFLVMEHVQGTLLGRLVAEQGTLDVTMAIDYVTQLLDALYESHATGIVHADVKSDNVLVEKRHDGTWLARLFDFGLARSYNEDLESERDLIYGTPHYMAPEVARGYPPSPASDLYSAGTLLYEMLTGTTPFAGGGSRDVLARQLNEDPVPPSRRRGDGSISERVDALVMRALEKRAAARFADARAFASELRALVSVAPLARGSCAQPVSITASTLDLNPVAVVDSSVVESSRVAELRRAVSQVVATGEAEPIISAYMGLARALLDEHAPAIAAAELEQAVERLTMDVDAGRPTPSLWCVLLTLAALYDHLGDLPRARKLARAAHDHASRAQSQVGQDRATALFARLIRNGTKRTPPALPAS